MTDPGNAAGNETGNEVTAPRAALTNAERQARFKARKRAEQIALGAIGLPAVTAPAVTVAKSSRAPRGRFPAGNTLQLAHGAYSPGRVEPLAAQIRAELLASPHCPPYLRDDTSHAYTLELWSSAMAMCRLLRAALSDMDVIAGITEVIDGEETETRPDPVTMKRVTRSERVQPLMDALHRHESRAMHLATRLGLDPLARGRLGADLAGAQLDAARYWAQRYEQKKAGQHAPD